jgi:hypothetical protein
MADDPEKVDWRKEAENAGFKVVPVADMTAMESAQKLLNETRAKIPNGFQGKEDEFFTTAQNAIARIKALEDGEKTDLEKSTARIADLETANATLTTQVGEFGSVKERLEKENESLYVGMDLRNEATRRNIYVHPKFVTDALYGKVDRKKYDLETDAGKKEYGDALYTNILEPAYNEQQEVARTVSGMNKKPDVNGNPENNSDKEPQSVIGWGVKS